MRRIVWVMLGLFFSLTLFGNVWSQSHPVMHPDEVTFRKWMDDYENGPRAFIDEVIHDRLNEAQAVGAGTSMDLLGYLKYTPSQRDQVSCGDCWLWASTGVMEIALNVQNKINDRLSIQLLQSCNANQNACCGGNPNGFADWYRGKAFMIPWSNANASFQDGNRPCDNGSSLVSCGNISTTLNYPITSIQPVIIPTQGVGQSKAISNIKNILHQNKAVYYAFWLPEDAGWPAFHDLWNNHNESSVWNPDPYSGQTLGGGHAVLIVGYNDDDPANPYWIVLNSWGTQNGLRPNGLFHLAMKINYDDFLYDGTQKASCLQFYTYDVTFNTQSHVTQKTNLTPYQPSGWSDNIVITNTTGCGDTCQDSSFLSETDTLYVNWAVLNDSDVDINTPFNVDLYVDGVYMDSWLVDSLPAHYYEYVTDSSIGSLGSGPHDIKIVADSQNAIDEADETDNEYTKTILVEGNISSGADLSSEYAYLMRSCKASWSGVSCKITGNVLILNVGDFDAPSTHTEVLLYNPLSGDVTLLQRINTPKLKAGYSRNLRVNTKLPPAVGFGSGQYIVILADADGTIDEPDWDNNFLFLGPFDPVTGFYTNNRSGLKHDTK
jgi:C1A family cysteine protease